MRDTLDRFYTPTQTVQKCLEYLSIDEYDIIIEPSAGSGSFSIQLQEQLNDNQKLFAYDIAPGNVSRTKKN